MATTNTTPTTTNTSVQPTGLLSTAAPETTDNTGGTDLSQVTNTASTNTVTTPETVASVVDATPASTFDSREVTSNETVSGQMGDLLDENSEYMQSARNYANEASNSRGMLNSSLAVGSAQRAAIDAAAPIAEADAATYANAAQSAQEANQQLGLYGYQSLLDSAQKAEDFTNDTTMNERNITANKELQAQQDAAEMERLEADASNQIEKLGYESYYEQQLQAQKDAAALELQTYLNENISAEAAAKIEASGQEAISDGVSPIFQQMVNEINAIQQIPDSEMSASDKATAIEELKNQAYAAADTISSLFGYEVTWA